MAKFINSITLTITNRSHSFVRRAMPLFIQPRFLSALRTEVSYCLSLRNCIAPILFVLLLCLTAFPFNSSAQTSSVNKHNRADAQIDSLQNIVASLLKRIDQLEKRVKQLEDDHKQLHNTSQSNDDTGTINKTAPESNTKNQCSATTKKGTRCSRTTTDPSGKCWQHRR